MYTGKIFTVIAGNYTIDKLFILILLRGTASPQALKQKQKLLSKKSRNI